MFGPAGMPRMQEIAVDSRVLAFAMGIAVLTGLVFGVLPALQMSRYDVSAVLRSSTRGTSKGGGRYTIVDLQELRAIADR